MGTVGVAPVLKQQVFDNLERVLGVHLPTAPGLDTMGCMQAADRGAIRSAVCLGGNLFGSNPDSKFAARALGKLDLVTYLSTTLNTGHAWGLGRETIVLPVLARDDEQQPTTQESMFNYVRLSEGGSARHQGPRDKVDILATIARIVVASLVKIDLDAGTDLPGVEANVVTAAFLGSLEKNIPDDSPAGPWPFPEE